MRSHPLAFVVSALVGGAFLGCAGAGSSGTHAAVVPQGGESAAGRVTSGNVRRTQSSPACSGAVSGAFVGGGTSNAADANNAGILAGQSNQVCEDDAAIGGGEYNVVSSGSDSAKFSWIGGGFQNTITGSATSSIIGGGSYNGLAQQYSVIGGGQSNTITSAQPLGVIAGGGNNTSSGSAAVISGGYGSTNAGQNGVIGGGQQNTVSSSAQYATIAGGSSNTVSGEYGAIAGGVQNNVSGEGGYIAAGGYNTVGGEGAVIDGGFQNSAAGNFATIPGGYENSAAGIYSFAAGVHASAIQNGTFVWSDGSNGGATLASTAAYQFLARAAGGFTLWTNAAATVGVKLAPGSGAWASASDRNLKTDVARLDDAAVLEKVASLPIERWSYKSERGVRHVGPMAQDFYAAFGVGEDDKHITSIDEDGVALAAIKALHAENADARAAIKLLHVENAQLRARLATANASESARIAAMQMQLRRLSAQVATLHGG